MDINGYPIIAPMRIENKDYGLKFTGDNYTLVDLDTLKAGVQDLDGLVLNKMKEDPKYLKRINMKRAATHKKNAD